MCHFHNAGIVGAHARYDCTGDRIRILHDIVSALVGCYFSFSGVSVLKIVVLVLRCLSLSGSFARRITRLVVRCVGFRRHGIGGRDTLDLLRGLGS